MKTSIDILKKNLCQHRKKRSMTQEQLSEISNISVHQISNIERGKANPSLDVLCALATALCITPDILLLPEADENAFPFQYYMIQGPNGQVTFEYIVEDTTCIDWLLSQGYRIVGRAQSRLKGRELVHRISLFNTMY